MVRTIGVEGMNTAAVDDIQVQKQETLESSQNHALRVKPGAQIFSFTQELLGKQVKFLKFMLSEGISQSMSPCHGCTLLDIEE